MVVSTAAPGTDERKRDGAAAVKTLEQPDRLFRLAEVAGCVTTPAKAHFTVIREESHGAGKAHGEASHGGKRHAGERSRVCGNADGHRESHGDVGSHRGHRDYYGAYTFTCSAPARLREVGLVYFETLPKAGKLTVQLIGPKGQSQVEETRASATVDLARVN